MTRTVSSPTLTAAGAGVSRPAYLIEITWQASTTRSCTYGTVTWNGFTWTGAGIEVGDFDDRMVPSQLVFYDHDNTWRTLVQSDGIRDRSVKIWRCDISALAVGDPVLLFQGFGDGARIEQGRVTMYCSLVAAAREYCPRERIGPGIGINFVAPANTVIRWGLFELKLISR